MNRHVPHPVSIIKPTLISINQNPQAHSAYHYDYARSSSIRIIVRSSTVLTRGLIPCIGDGLVPADVYPCAVSEDITSLEYAIEERRRQDGRDRCQVSSMRMGAWEGAYRTESISNSIHSPWCI